MANHELHWGEGLFLRPHHFQASARLLRESVLVSENWLTGYPYGLHHIEFDEDALLNWRISLTSCHIRLQDGTHLRYPEDATVDPIAIPRESFRSDDARATAEIFINLLKLLNQQGVSDLHGIRKGKF